MRGGILIGVIITWISKCCSGLQGVSVWCMTEYERGGAPAVYGSPECPWQWRSLQNQTHNNCDFAIIQGRRKHQEDAIVCDLNFRVPLITARDDDAAGKNRIWEEEVGIVAVFDGHGGKEASELASKLLLDYFYLHVLFQSYEFIGQHQIAHHSHHSQILKEALSRTISDIDLKFSQEAIKNNIISGSTAAVALLYNGKILVANVGDSRALLFSENIQSVAGAEGNSRVPLSVTVLTDDHHPDREDERARIEAAGGSVTMWRVPRVNGVLAMSRAIGDVYLKRYGVIAEPEFRGWQLLTDNHTHLTVASDGIFESLTQQDISDLISEWNSHLQGSQNPNMSFPSLTSTSLAECITNIAYERGSHDNLSVIVVHLRPPAFG